MANPFAAAACLKNIGKKWGGGGGEIVAWLLHCKIFKPPSGWVPIMCETNTSSEKKIGQKLLMIQSIAGIQIVQEQEGGNICAQCFFV